MEGMMQENSMRGTAIHRAGKRPWSSILALFSMLLMVIAPSAVARADAAAERWVNAFWPEAQRAGISRDVYVHALSGFTPDPDILRRAGSQPEFSKPIWEYLATAVSAERINNGRAMLARYAQHLARIEAMYGVDRHILVAIWGMESAYGAILDGNSRLIKPVIRSLATLAYQGGSRAEFGRTQLIAALKILQNGDVRLADMSGSWAGAMGHTQFIPTSYLAYAVDYDGDGRRNVWSSPLDALASAANYLRRNGWHSSETWGYEVRLPVGFDYRLAEGGSARAVAEWQRLGVTRARGGSFPRPGDEATLFAPAGARGPAFLVIKNFRVIKRYNNANSYALAIGHLADRLMGYDTFVANWPVGDRPLSRTERAELQQLLAAKGLYRGAIDAEIGSGSRAAIRAFQASIGTAADGHASLHVLEQLRRDG
jgi:membrane-bound lytic murein transglycosylase B